MFRLDKCGSMGGCGLMLFLALVMSTSMLATAAAKPPSQDSLNEILKEAQKVIPELKNIAMENFEEDDGAWVAKDKTLGRLIVYSPPYESLSAKKREGILHFALIRDDFTLKELLGDDPGINFGFDKLIAIYAGKETHGPLSVAKLPSPIKTELDLVAPHWKTIDLAPGTSLIGQLDLGKTPEVEEVVKTIANQSTYLTTFNSHEKKKSVIIEVAADNNLNRLLTAGPVLSGPRDSRTPTLRIDIDDKKRKYTYQAAYDVLWLKDVDTKVVVAEDKNTKLKTFSMRADLGDRVDPILVPGYIELKNIEAKDLVLNLVVEQKTKGTTKGSKVTPSFTASEMIVSKTKKTTYNDVKLSVSTLAGTPTQGNLEFNTKDDVGVREIVDLFETVAVSYPPLSGKDWNLVEAWQLDKVPGFTIEKPVIIIDTPKFDEEISKLNIAALRNSGANAVVSGQIVAFDKKLGKIDLKVAGNGVRADANVKDINLGLDGFKLKTTDTKLKIVLHREEALFKQSGKAELQLPLDGNLTLAEADINYSAKGGRFVYDAGCSMPMVKVDVKIKKNMEPKSVSVNPSSCAQESIKAVAEVAEKAYEEVSEATVEAAFQTYKGLETAGEGIVTAVNEIGKALEDVGCEIEDWFTGDSCSKDKKKKAEKRAKAAEEKAVKLAEEYRKKAGPAHCFNGAYWNQKMGSCWKKDYKMVSFQGKTVSVEVPDWKGVSVSDVLAGKAKLKTKKVSQKLCLNAKGGYKAEEGSAVNLGSCSGKWWQQFREHEKDGVNRLRNHKNLCVRANKDGSVELDKCNTKSSQHWRYANGKLVDHKNRCLVSENNEASANGEKLVLQNCSKKANGRKASAPHWVFVEPQRDPYELFPTGNGFRYNANIVLDKDGSCLDSSRDQTSGEYMRARECKSKRSAQEFRLALVSQKKKEFVIVSERSKMCLEAVRDKNKKTVKARQMPCDFGEKQRWIATKSDSKNANENFERLDKTFYLYNPEIGLYLRPGTDDGSEKFKLVKAD